MEYATLIGGPNESIVESLKGKRESMRVKTNLMQDRRLEITNIDRVLRNVISDFIGLAIGQTRLDTAARHPHGIGVGMMISTNESLSQIRAHIVLHHGCSTKFTAPDNQSGVQQSTALKIDQQSADGSINLPTLDG